MQLEILHFVLTLFDEHVRELARPNSAEAINQFQVGGVLLLP